MKERASRWALGEKTVDDTHLLLRHAEGVIGRHARSRDALVVRRKSAPLLPEHGTPLPTQTQADRAWTPGGRLEVFGFPNDDPEWELEEESTETDR